MARTLFTLDEALAILGVVHTPPRFIEAFRTQATLVLGAKPAKALDNVTVASGYGTESRSPFVELTIDRTLTQMDAAKAREIGLMLLEAAEAAVSDAIFVQLLETRVGITDHETQGRILLDLRELRQGSKGTVYPS